MSDTNEVARVKTHRTQAKQFRPFQLADNATLVVLAQTFARDIDILLAHIERQQAIVEAARAVNRCVSFDTQTGRPVMGPGRDDALLALHDVLGKPEDKPTNVEAFKQLGDLIGPYFDDWKPDDDALEGAGANDGT